MRDLSTVTHVIVGRRMNLTLVQTAPAPKEGATCEGKAWI